MPSRLSLALLLTLVATPVRAQSPDTLAVASGVRLRIATRWTPAPLAATLLHQTRDGLVVATHCRDCAIDSVIAWRDLQRVDVRIRSGPSAKWTVLGAGAGLVAGTAVGFLAAMINGRVCVASNDACEAGLLLIPAGSIVGVISGVLIGRRVDSARWVPVWPPAPRR